MQEVVTAQFGATVRVFRSFGRIRRARNSFEYPAFAAAIRGTQPVPVDPWDAVATAAVLDAARTSARTGQVVRPARTT